MLTSPDHPSGTDRVAEVARSLGEGDSVVINIQGDEPLLTPTSLDRLVAAFDAVPPPRMATLAEPIDRPQDLFDRNDRFGPVDLLDHLRARLGDNAVTGLSTVAEHRPEYAWRYKVNCGAREGALGRRRSRISLSPTGS